MAHLREPRDRKTSDLRPITIDTQVNRYAEGSALIRAGHTHVLCTATLEDKVPPWLEGKGEGWITAEYSMLPRSTHTRSRRDREKVSGRTLEIQRLIGRALRGAIDLKKLGEKTLTLDCDVLQADGGTRTASITGGFVALAIALDKAGVLKSALVDSVSAISLGLKTGEIYVDLDYNEDSTCDVDMNFIVTGSGKLIEVQGTAERESFETEQLFKMIEAATEASKHLKKIQLETLKNSGVNL